MYSRLSNKRTVHLLFLHKSSLVDTVISLFSLKHVRPVTYLALFIFKQMSPVQLLGSLEYLHYNKKKRKYIMKTQK
jgi:hypothetical protein